MTDTYAQSGLQIAFSLQFFQAKLLAFDRVDFPGNEEQEHSYWAGPLCAGGSGPSQSQRREHAPHLDEITPSLMAIRRQAALNRVKYLGVNSFATANAPRSSVSRAIFWASMTSPATRETSGTKHQPARGRPASSSSSTFATIPWRIRYRFPVWQPLTSK